MLEGQNSNAALKMLIQEKVGEDRELIHWNNDVFL